MQAKTQTWFSFFFFVGSVFVSLVVVQGGWSDLWRSSPQSVSSVSSGSSGSLDVPWVSQNLDVSVLNFLNKKIIPAHQRVSYAYLMMSTYFSRADVALPGFAKYFREASDRELGNVNFWITYINKRGGHVDLRHIEASSRSQWTDGVDALKFALRKEKHLHKEAIALYEVADVTHDPHLSHIVEDHVLEPKVNLIKELGDHIAILESMEGDAYGLAEYVFDGNL